MIYLLIYMGLNLVGIGMAIGNHKKEEKRIINAWNYILSTAICWTLLYMGGAFNPLFGG